jgi:hypothetical protein
MFLPARAFVEANTDRGEGSSRMVRLLSGTFLYCLEIVRTNSMSTGPGVAPPDDNLSPLGMFGDSSRSGGNEAPLPSSFLTDSTPDTVLPLEEGALTLGQDRRSHRSGQSRSVGDD